LCRELIVTTSEKLLSVKSPWGIVILAAAGIWLSWSTKYVKKLFGNIALWIHLPRPRPSNGDEAVTETTSLLNADSGSPDARNVQSLAKIFKEKSGIRDLFTDCFFNKELQTGDKLRLLAFTTGVVICASLVIVGGSFLAKIKADGPARLASGTCGLWLFEGEKRSEAATRAGLIDLGKEERAAQFARDCYGASGSLAPRCKTFYQPKLPVSDAIYTNECLFKNGICRYNQTVTFQTPWIDAKELGINSPSTPKFLHRISCAPLAMDYPYIKSKTENGTTTFTYHYGSKKEDGRSFNYTYMTVGHPWDRVAPVYDVFAYSSNTEESNNSVWIPHSNLAPPKYSTVTIIFVSSLRILYEERSEDPIFPADQEWRLPGDDRPWFRNSDPRARPFACINTIEVCTPDGTACWNFNEPTSENQISDNTTDYILLYASLFRTDVYFSIAKRQGRALLAQNKVSQYFSTALGDDPWVAEVSNLARISLARTSINTWSVASGEDSVHEGKDGFVDDTKKYGNLCGRYKYNPQGYQSLRFVPLLLVAAWVPFIWFITLDWKPIESQVMKTFQGLRKLTRDVVLKCRDVVLKRRAHRVSSRIGDDQSRLDVSNTSPNPATLASQETTGTIGSSPSQAGPSMSVGAQQVTPVQQPSTISNSTSQNSTPDDEEVIEWEPLVFHEILCCVFFWIPCTILYVVFHWLPRRLLCCL
jgi:hypothetical protein